MAGLSDEEVFGSAPTREAQSRGLSDEEVFGASPKGLSDADVFGAQSSDGVIRTGIEFGKGLIVGTQGNIASALKGTGALYTGLAEEQLAALDRPNEAPSPDASPAELAAYRLRRSVVHPSSDIVEERRKQFTEQASRPVAQHPLTQAGTATEQFGTSVTAPAPGYENSFTRDLGAAFGSVGGNLALSAIPVVGPLLAPVSFVTAGSGEAYDRAIKAGASEAEARKSSRYGTVAGASDLADLALLRIGVRSGGAVRRALTKMIEGGLIEGTQEGAQQFIQNMIARGIYKPEQELSEGVLYSAFLGAIVGGSVAPLTSRGREGTETPPTPEQIAATAQSFLGPETPSPSVPTSVPVFGEVEGPPPVTSPNEYGAVPPETAPAPANVVPVEPPKSMLSPDVVEFLNKHVGPLRAPEAETTTEAAPPLEASRQDLGDVKANPGFSMRTAALLGSNLYGGPDRLSQVTVKEIVQNSFDAIKGLIDSGKETEGNIEIELDPTTRTINVQDDGSGIPLEVLAGPFFQVGGTHKTTTRASGGHGIAKMVPIFGNEDLRLATMHNGIVYSIQSRGQDLFDFLEKGDESKRPIIKRRTPTADDRATFPKGHGTLISVKLPQSYVDPSTGAVREIPFTMYNHEVLSKSPLFDNIQVTLNGRPLPIGKNFPITDFVPLRTINFAWGTARLYVSKNKVGSAAYNNVSVLSNGLWQFEAKIAPAGKPYEALPYKFYVDVSPKVESGQPGYPFALDRQSFSPRVEEDFAQIFNYVSLLYSLEDFKSNVENYGDMQYLERGPSGKVVVGSRTRVELSAPLPKSPLEGVPLDSKNWSVENGRLVIAGKVAPDLGPDQLRSFRIDFSGLKIPQEQIDASKVILHDNTAVRISDSETRTLSDMAREKFGESFDEYVHDVGNLFIELRNEVSRLLALAYPGLTPDATGNSVVRYSDMVKDAIGISFDPTYRGVSIRVPFHAEMLNLALPESVNDPVFAAVSMFYTKVHELAHFADRSEDRRELQRILGVLDTAPDFSVQGFKQRLVDVVSRNWEIQKYLHGVMTSGTFVVESRGKRFETDSEQARTGGGAQDVGAPRAGTGGESAILRGPPVGAIRSEAEPGHPNRTPEAPRLSHVAGTESNAASTQSEDQRLLDSEVRGVPAVPRQPEVEVILDKLRPAFAKVGGIPKATRVAAAHASRMNRGFKWTAGIDQLVKSNPFFEPLLRYTERIRQMHNEESVIHDAALRVAKRWRSLGEEGDRVAGFLDALANMHYLSPQEVQQGVKRMPTQQETTALIGKFKLSAQGLEVANAVRNMFSGFLSVLEANAIQAAQRIVRSDPIALAKKIDEIRAQIAELRRKPYFPFLRFGRHYVVVKDAAGRVIHFETFERKGFVSAEARQQRAFRAERARRPTTEKVDFGIISEAATPFLGLPPTLLEQIKTELQLTPDQLSGLEQIQLSYAPALSFRKRMMKSDYIPGYSKDFMRAFARYFFHGGRYYARTKYGHDLNRDIAEASAAESDNKAHLIADYMKDHLHNTVLDAKGDFGIFKAGIFLWAMGYVPAAAAQNLSQTVLTTYPYLAAKFGGIGIGDARASAALVKAMTDVRNFYKKGAYDKATEFEMAALGYGIRTGRITETQAPELAGISAGANLIEGIGGNKAQRGWVWFMENGAKLFELAEQFNRRVAYRAALDLAMKHPNSKAVRDATRTYANEFLELQRASSGRRAFTVAEAAAVVTAAHVTDETQFIYARYARPRFMRGRLAGALFVFKKYVQSMLFFMGQNKSDVLPRQLIIMALLGGLAGIPGYDDLRDLLRAFAHWAFGREFNLDREVREYVLAITNGKVPPDLVLHGMARQGFGLPALLDLMGSAPSRGLDPKMAGQNVPFPVLDRSRAISMGSILPVEVGKLFGPQRSPDHVMAEQVQRASGAVFSVGFNLYKAIVDSNSEGSDFKRWERAMPRALSGASRSYRAYSEGRERGRGRPDSAPTIVPFDVRDTEQMMEILAMGMGYQPLRLQAKWDLILAEAEAKAYFDLKRQGLLQQMFEAQQGRNPKEIATVVNAIKQFNADLPKWAKAKSIDGDTVDRSLQARAVERFSRERGIPSQESNIGISREMQRLFPEATVDVRKVR